MLSKHADRVCTFFAVDFEPHLGAKLGTVAEQIHAERKPAKTSIAAPVSYTFAWPDDRILMILGFQRIAWQTLGLSAWGEKLEEHASVMKSALNALEVEKFNRIGFKVEGYLPLGMSHAELSQLMFGSFLVPAEELHDVCEEVDDPLVRMEGKRNGLQCLVTLCAMNTEQVSRQFLHVNNLEHFIQHKLLDTTVKDFHDGITRDDCFYFDIDLFDRDVSADTLDSFMKTSLATCEEIANASVRRLQSQPVK